MYEEKRGKGGDCRVLMSHELLAQFLELERQYAAHLHEKWFYVLKSTNTQRDNYYSDRVI